jgi:type I restriction enzyme M protein
VIVAAQAGEIQRTTSRPVAVIVQQGKTLDYIDGITQRNETPEEYVRQEIAKSLVREYGYEKAEVSVEFVLRLGSRKPRADLVIFDEGDKHDQDRARIIIECKSQKIKSSDRKEGIGQLQSYLAACPNVTYGMWTNGLERYCYRRVDTNGSVKFEEIPDIPGKGRTEDEVERPRFDQLKAASSDALLFAFRRCHNYIAGNQGLQKPEAFWELLKIIFCKIHDERGSDEVEFYATSKERHGLNGQLKVKARIARLFDEVKAEYPTIFRENEVVELNDSVRAYIVSQLQMYSLLESDIDVKGRAYEEIVGSNLRGDRGEFFTPRNICQMAVAMLDPGERQMILDPACGTGGFLITAMNYVIEKIRSAEIGKWGDVERAETAIRQRMSRFAQNYIIGMDLNPNLVKASKMNMVMNNDGAGGLYQANSLKAPATWEDSLRDRQIMGQVDLLFTNPPFGSKIPIDEPSILEAYDLGHNWSYDADNDK